MSEAIETLRWRETANSGQLEMIDQTRLPATFEYLSYDSADGVAHGIRTMVVRGAPAIGVAAAYGVALEALRLCRNASDNFDQQLELGFTKLAESRPTAVNLFWALNRMRRCWQQHATQAKSQLATS
ncbi:MAG: S-methyl-5-thioribose-phosphate isomerase, partial [Pseudomonadota bacterium]